MEKIDALTELSTNLMAEINKVNKQLPEVLKLRNQCMEIKKELDLEDEKREKRLDTKLKKKLKEVDALCNQMQENIKVLNKKVLMLEQKMMEQTMHEIKNELSFSETRTDPILERAKQKYPEYVYEDTMILALLDENLHRMPLLIESETWLDKNWMFRVEKYDENYVYGDIYEDGVLTYFRKTLEINSKGFWLVEDEEDMEEDDGNQTNPFMYIPNGIDEDLPF